MIIARIRSGLGNQFFQYAMARALALRTGQSLKLDLSAYEQRRVRFYRHYGLAHCGIVADVATPEEVGHYRCRRGKIRGGLYYYVEKLRPRWDAAFVRERDSYRYDPEMAGMQIEGTVYLAGYWQSEKYFEDAAGTIREELELVQPPEGRNRELAEAIGACPSVSLHIRRGDYVQDLRVRGLRGGDGLEYYGEAIALIREREPELQLFVFSDDISWVRENLTADCPVTYVDNNRPETSHEDLRLMSLCRHNIITNSSFSWWGAWLNRNPEKRVVAPRRWLNDGRDVAGDLIPDGWTVI
jgi:hypothetical protein